MYQKDADGSLGKGCGRLPPARADRHAGRKADDRGQQPAKVFIEQGKMRGGEGNGRIQMERGLHRRGQRFHAVENGGGPCADHGRDINGAVMREEFAEEGEKNERNRRGIDEHEHGNGVFNDSAQPDVRHGKGKHREEDRPAAVGDLPVRHLGKGLRAGGDQTDGGLETGKGDGEGKNKQSHAAEVMSGNLREGDAAVFRQLEEPS